MIDSPEKTPSLKRLRRQDLNLFVVLDAIYREQSLTAAGERLGLTQPAMSHALRRLREMMGDDLFGRQGASMTPTPFARNIISDVRRALLILEGRLHEQRRFDPVNANQIFRLGLSERTEIILLPNLIDWLGREAPGVSVVSTDTRPDGIESGLANGHVDLVLEASVPVSAAIRRRMLAQDELVVAVRRGHSVLSGRSLSLEQYLALNHVLVAGNRGAGVEDHELSRRGLRRTVVVQCQSHKSALEIILHSDILLTLSRLEAETITAADELEFHPFPLDAPMPPLTLYWHASMQDDPANSWLRQAIDLLMLNDKTA